MSDNLQKNTVVLDVRFAKPGATRKGSLDGIDTGADDKNSVALNKKYIKSEHYQKCIDIEIYLKRRVIDRFKLKSPFREGTYLIPVPALDEIYPALEKAQEQFKAASEAFVKDWDNIVEDARKRLGTQFRSSEYPSAQSMKGKFGMSYRLMSFETPDASVLGDILYKKEVLKAKQTWDAAREEVTVALRESMAELVNHLIEQMTPKTDGSRTVLRGAAVERVQDFLDTFSKRNVLGDSELQVLVEKASRVLAIKSAERIRDNDDVKTAVKVGLKKVAKELDALMTTSKRKIRFED